MAIDMNQLKVISSEYGLDVELPDLESPTLSGRVVILSGPRMPPKEVFDELTKRFSEACPDLVRVLFEIKPEASA